MARVSIITALFNHEKYIDQAVKSVLSQTFDDWEHLIWDDGSTDQSLEIARHYAAQDPRIKVFTHSGGGNRGQERTRNLALEKASGDLIGLLDSDDLYYPRKLEWLVPCFEQLEVGMAYGRFDHLVEATGKRVPSGIMVSPAGKIFRELAHDNFIGAGATLFRRECVEEGLRFDPAFRTTGEYPLWLKIAKDWDVACVDGYVATWRDHGENLGTKLAVQAKREQVELFTRLIADPEYAAYAKDLETALTKRHYDYANVLYQELELSEARAECFRVFASKHTPLEMRLKSGVLFGASCLPRLANRYLAVGKHRLWKLRRRLKLK